MRKCDAELTAKVEVRPFGQFLAARRRVVLVAGERRGGTSPDNFHRTLRQRASRSCPNRHFREADVADMTVHIQNVDCIARVIIAVVSVRSNIVPQRAVGHHYPDSTL